MWREQRRAPDRDVMPSKQCDLAGGPEIRTLVCVGIGLVHGVLKQQFVNSDTEGSRGQCEPESIRRFMRI
jgi:hypothetical protein